MNMPEPSPMSIALDRAMKAAETDPLVEAVEVIQGLLPWLYKALADGAFDGCANPSLARKVVNRAERLLESYRPQA